MVPSFKAFFGESKQDPLYIEQRCAEVDGDLFSYSGEVNCDNETYTWYENEINCLPKDCHTDIVNIYILVPWMRASDDAWFCTGGTNLTYEALGEGPPDMMQCYHDMNTDAFLEYQEFFETQNTSEDSAFPLLRQRCLEINGDIFTYSGNATCDGGERIQEFEDELYCLPTSCTSDEGWASTVLVQKHADYYGFLNCVGDFWFEWFSEGVTFPSDGFTGIPGTIGIDLISSERPSISPSLGPTRSRSESPSILPSVRSTTKPSLSPTGSSSGVPPVMRITITPSHFLTGTPSDSPTVVPSSGSPIMPSVGPTRSSSGSPSMLPSVRPMTLQKSSYVPSETPSMVPSIPSSERPSTSPSLGPTRSLSESPSVLPSVRSMTNPSLSPTGSSSGLPSIVPPVMRKTITPSHFPPETPSDSPTVVPSERPTSFPSLGATRSKYMNGDLMLDRKSDVNLISKQCEIDMKTDAFLTYQNTSDISQSLISLHQHCVDASGDIFAYSGKVTCNGLTQIFHDKTSCLPMSCTSNEAVASHVIAQAKSLDGSVCSGDFTFEAIGKGSPAFFQCQIDFAAIEEDDQIMAVINLVSMNVPGSAAMCEALDGFDYFDHSGSQLCDDGSMFSIHGANCLPSSCTYDETMVTFLANVINSLDNDAESYLEEGESNINAAKGQALQCHLFDMEYSGFGRETIRQCFVDFDLFKPILFHTTKGSTDFELNSQTPEICNDAGGDMFTFSGTLICDGHDLIDNIENLPVCLPTSCTNDKFALSELFADSISHESIEQCTGENFTFVAIGDEFPGFGSNANDVADVNYDDGIGKDQNKISGGSFRASFANTFMFACAGMFLI